MSDSSAQHPQQPSPSWQSTTDTLQASNHLQASNAGPVPAQTYYPYYWPPQYSQYYRTTYPVSSSGQFLTAAHPAAARTDLPGQASSSIVNTINSKDGKKIESLNGNAEPGPIEHWDRIIRQFLEDLGLTQALAGFEADMLIMNSEWEKKKVPKAIRELDRTLQATLRVKTAGADVQSSELAGTNIEDPETQTPDSLLDERKLAYAHYSEGAKPRTPTQINKEISSFLARNRKRNDASNRTEFLRSLSEKRAALAAIESDSTLSSASNTPVSSCARVDAKTIDRDVQMKYDIAKNEEGALRKTIAPSAATSKDKGKGKAVDNEDVEIPDENTALETPVTATTHPALTERLQNVEKHFNVRYVPSPPLGLLDRLKLLEEHIIRLEKDYPPWAALHFNQPNRGWPPPPRSTPIIVPSNMKRVQGKPVDIPSGIAPSGTPSEEANRQGSDAPTKSKKSSLHRAVMEKLEVKQAMEDLAGSTGRG